MERVITFTLTILENKIRMNDLDDITVKDRSRSLHISKSFKSACKSRPTLTSPSAKYTRQSDANDRRTLLHQCAPISICKGEAGSAGHEL